MEGSWVCWRAALAAVGAGGWQGDVCVAFRDDAGGWRKDGGERLLFVSVSCLVEAADVGGDGRVEWTVV